MIGCDCDVCQSPDPRDQRLRSSIYIETPECAWVVDTGTDFRTQALRENIRRVDAVVFTHSHTDHIMGFDDLRRFSHARGSMPIYASPETMRDLERVFQFAFNTSNPVPYYLKPEPHIIHGPFKLGETLITPLPVPHGDSMVNGYLFSRANRKLVAYLSDCSAVPDAIVDLISGVRVLIIDALRDRTASDTSERWAGPTRGSARKARVDLFYSHLPRSSAGCRVPASHWRAHCV